MIPSCYYLYLFDLGTNRNLLDFWMSVFERYPGQYKNVYFLEQELEIDTALSLFASGDPFMKNVIGIDSEFVSGPHPYMSWDKENFRFISRTIDRDSNGPFSRLFQVGKLNINKKIHDKTV